MQGKLWIIGIGPGAREHMTLKAMEALKAADVVVGYKMYIRLLGDLVQGKKVYVYGMKEEVQRARKALELAVAGLRVALVSSGDAGVYGMASLALELLGSMKGPSLDVEIVPGVTAALAAASLLGAPLGHDFAVISLSDMLTPWEAIRRRIEAAAAADFALTFYNPIDKNKVAEAFDVVAKYRGPDAPAGVVKAAYREGQKIILTKLKLIPLNEIDMESIIIIGNSTTYIYDKYMITPRGYKSKYVY